MCRLLLLIDPAGTDPGSPLAQFRRLSRDSREYQGHGWGCAWLDGQDRWHFHHDIRPVWEDDRTDFPRTRLFIGHARSAFRDEGIVVENNMPFSDGDSVFIFNGELRGVKVKADGRIGAEKIYNYVRRFDRGDLGAAMRKAVGIIEKRTRYVRAMNFILARPDRVHVCSLFGEDPEYFQLRQRRSGDTVTLCSEPFPDDDPADWTAVPNHEFIDISLNGKPA